MSDLSSIPAEFAAQWLLHHCEVQPPSDHSLTWYVQAATLYSAYVSECYAKNVAVLSFVDLWKVIQIMLPLVKPQKLKGQGVYSGIRFHPTGDGIKF